MRTVEIAESLGGRFEYVKEPQSLILIIGQDRYEFKADKRLPYNELLAIGVPELVRLAKNAAAN